MDVQKVGRQLLYFRGKKRALGPYSISLSKFHNGSLVQAHLNISQPSFQKKMKRKEKEKKKREKKEKKTTFKVKHQ